MKGAWQSTLPVGREAHFLPPPRHRVERGMVPRQLVDCRSLCLLWGAPLWRGGCDQRPMFFLQPHGCLPSLARFFLFTLHLQRRDLHTYTHTHIHCVRVCPPYCICRGHFGPIARRDLCQGRGASRAHTSLAARGVDVAWQIASAGRLARKRYGSRPAHGTLRHTHECGRGRRARASERETEVSTLPTCCRAPDWSSQRPHVVIIRVPRVRTRREEGV